MRERPVVRGFAWRGARAAANGVLVAAISGAAAALGLQGCGPGILDFCAVPDPPADLCCPDPKNPGCPAVDGGDAGDSGSDAAGDAAADGPIAPACPGQCVPYPASGWDLPALVYIGPEIEAPPCPDLAPADGYDGHADLTAPNVCAKCQCGPPTGSCDLPTVLTASAATCAMTDPSTPTTSFDAPDAWDGGCTTSEAVPGGLLCDGSDCVQSLTIGPLAMNETGCVPMQPAGAADAGSVHMPASWKTFTRLCHGLPPGSCGNPGLICTAPFSAGDGLHLCIFQKGDADCTDAENGPYQEKHVFYKSFQDTRSCSSCICGSPVGSTCTAQVSIFGDDTCAPMASYVETIDSVQPACLDLITGAALSSKSASTPTYMPGTCEPSGGEPMGSADPIGPSTLCCIPSP